MQFHLKSRNQVQGSVRAFLTSSDYHLELVYNPRWFLHSFRIGFEMDTLTDHGNIEKKKEKKIALQPHIVCVWILN